MSRPLDKNRGPKQRSLRWLAEHPEHGKCKSCGRWRTLYNGWCGYCWQVHEAKVFS